MRSKPTRNLILRCLTLLPAILFAMSIRSSAQQPASWKLKEIEFTGLNRCARDKAVEVSGLYIGEKVDLGIFDSATNRLRKSGFFRAVNYRYSYTAETASISFEVQEALWVPVVYDNFIWLADEDINAAVKRADSAFDGTAPAYGEVPETIKKTLESMLASKGVSSAVDYTSGSFAGDRTGIIFRAAGVKLPLCSLHVSTGGAVREGELLKLAKPLLAADYSRSFVEAFAAANLLPVYRERGYLRASFQPPEAKSSAEAGCKNGVSVTLPVTEDAQFNWDKAEWSGNSALSAQELDAMLAMKTGDVANGLKFDAGVKAVRAGYGKRGFILCRLTQTPAFDAQRHLVTYQIRIDEGGQFKMGALNFLGFSDSEAAALSKKWKLETGKVFDASYLNEFADKLLKTLLSTQSVTYSLSPDREKLTVDVTLNLRQ